MERQGMEGNNLLHFLDTPSAHYRLYASSTFPSMFWFIQSPVLYCAFLLLFPWDMQFDVLPLFLLKELRWIWSRKWCRLSLWCIRFVFFLDIFLFHFCILEYLCVFVKNVSMLIICGNDIFFRECICGNYMSSGYKAYMLHWSWICEICRYILLEDTFCWNLFYWTSPSFSPHFAVSIDFNVLFACTVYLLNSCHASAIRFLKLKARMLGEKLN